MWIGLFAFALLVGVVAKTYWPDEKDRVPRTLIAGGLIAAATVIVVFATGG